MGGIVAIIAIITIIRRISAFYRQRYNFSIWSGVLLLTFAVIAAAFGYTYYNANIPFYISLICIGLIILTGWLDIRLAGFGMGLLALIIQLVLATGFIAVILFAIVYAIIRALRGGNDIILDAITGTSSGVRNGLSLFLRFFMP